MVRAAGFLQPLYLLVLALTLGVSRPSSPNRLPTYSVASIRLNRGGENGVEISATADGFEAKNVTLQALVAYAYIVYGDKVHGGPAWVYTDTYDIRAKVFDADIARLKELSGQQRRAMLKPILEDRFGLVIQTDTKMESVLKISAPDGDKKLKRSEDPPKPGEDESKRGYVEYGHLVARDQTMAGLATQLSFPLQQRVVDGTGLTGRYDFELRWTPGVGEAKFLALAGDNAAGPSIYTAMKEQLGLRLSAAKVPTDVIRIVAVHRPTEN